VSWESLIALNGFWAKDLRSLAEYRSLVKHPGRAARLALALVFVAAPLTVSQATTPVSTRAVRPPHGIVTRPRGRPLTSALLREGFTGDQTTPSGWFATGDACLTAGDASTPPTSIPACNAGAPLDRIGSGSLQLTQPATNRQGLAVFTTPFSTANGLQVTFTDATFDGSNPGGNGMTLFFSDASLPVPTAPGGNGGAALGYESLGGTPGIAGAYLGIGLDEFGAFSSGNGGPGNIAETIAVRGSAATGYQYIGGATNSAGQPASLPFALDAPSSSTRPPGAPTIRATLLASGQLTVEVDYHDGNGFRTCIAQMIVGVGGQPALPRQVYLGFSSATGSAFENHEVLGLSVTALPIVTTFAPTQIPNLAAWYDAADPWSISLAGLGVTAWQDRSAHGNVLAQTSPAHLPVYTVGINQLGSLAFSSADFLQSNNASFSSDLFNESTVLVVTNQSVSATSGNVLWSGSYPSGPAYSLRLSDGGVTRFDFGNSGSGRLSAGDVPSGPALWTAAGSVSGATQFLRKNGTTIASGPGPGATTSGSYPLVLGAATNGALPYTGSIAEVLVYNRFLSATEQATAEGYLACKWGLQNRLPNGHPYRAVCPGGGTPRSIPTPPPAAGALPAPPELRSTNGVLTFNVVAAANATTGFPQLLYNGLPTPPTLRLLQGDILLVNLTNKLPVAPPNAVYVNDTSLHYHGLQVSPNAPGDDSIDMIAMPGQSLHYRVAIPLDHPPGLYWYHSHAHGEAERQNLAGMSGALVIEGISQYVPAVANLPERILIAREAEPPGVALPDANRGQLAAMRWAMAHQPRTAMGRMSMDGMSMNLPEARSASTRRIVHNPYVVIDRNYRKFVRPLAVDTHCTAPESAPTIWTLNGATAPRIGIRPGEQQFWRLVNAGSDSYLDVAVDNAQMQIVALDGVPLSAGVNAPSSMTVSDYVLPPASRVEFLITGPPAGTTAHLRTLCFDAGSAGPAMPAAVLATIDPSTSPTDQLRHEQRVSLRAKRYRFHSVRFITTQPIARSQTLFYSDQNTINGAAYDPSAPPLFYAQSGTVEEWSIVNNSAQVHTFHMHQIHFVVESVNGTAPAHQFVLDNVNVPAATANGPGIVKVLLDFTDPVVIGTFLVHCHILSHEDSGMMAKIRVGTAPPLSTNSTQVTFGSPAAPAQNVTISGGQAPYSVSGCATVANGTISGSTLTVSPAGAGSCTLTIEDSTGLITSIQVTVAQPATIVLAPSSLGFANPAAAPASVGISGGTPPYGASGCSGTASTSISGATLTVTPISAGTCTVNVADQASNSAALAVSVNAFGGANAGDNVTFHQNPMRTGWYQSESALNTTNVGSSAFGLLGALSAPPGFPAFGKVYAQPLFATSERTSDGNLHNLVIVATATDQVYAFDDATDGVVWAHSFTNPPGGVTQQSSNDTDCDDVNPDVGITGTPVIDRTLDRIFVVVPTKENGVFHQRLHALSLATGAEAVAPVEVSGTVALASGGTASTDPEMNFNRSALLEANGTIYVPLGSHCDFAGNTTHGWILGYNASSLQPAGNLLNVTDQNTGSGNYLGAVWMSGFGPAADAQGNVYFATGNGPFNGTTDFGMAVLRVPGSLNLGSATYFSPFGGPADSASDQDLGAGGVLLFPDMAGSFPHLLIQGGKCGAGSASGGTQGCQKYILNRDALGGVLAGDAGALWHADTAGGIWGGPAFFQDTSGNSYIIYGTGNPLTTYEVGLTPVSLTPFASANVGCLECRNAGSQPIVSSLGTNPGTAIAWALKTPGNGGGTISLYAFDALTMRVLFAGAAGTWNVGSNATYIGGALVSPEVANGRVYVPTDGSVAVFGLH
jgi:FtsP/CotA-like multicopper oxidase with cupredoxin domain